jgi:antitoxin HicB
MSGFEKYTIIIRETPAEYHSEIKEHRFLSFLKEIPEASLHEYGVTQEESIHALREQFEFLKAELKSQGKQLPEPSRKSDGEYSGRIVLRMPAWLHRTVAERAEEEGLSINSYILNRLIKCTTLEEVVARVNEKSQEYRPLRKRK